MTQLYDTTQKTLYPTIETVAHQCSLPLYSQQQGNENNLDVHQVMNE